MKTNLWGEQVGRRQHAFGGVLVCVDQTRCPECDGELDTVTTEEPALLRHGGYGAMRTTVSVHCRCGYYRTNAVSELRPPR